MNLARASEDDYSIDVSRLSANPEVDHDRDQDVDRRARKTSRLESPLSDCCHGFFIEAAAVQRLDHTYLRRVSLACDDDFQHNGALNHLSERVSRIPWLDFFEQTRRGYGPASTVKAPAGSAARSWTESLSMSRANPGPRSGANAAPGPRTCRRA